MADDAPSVVADTRASGGAGEPLASATGEDADPLLVAALATFHTVALVVLGVSGLVVGGSVGDILSALDTELGFLLFLALWGIVAWTHWRLFRAISLADTPLRGLVQPALKWGAVTGWLFFAVLVLLVAGQFLVTFLGGGGFASLRDLVTTVSILFGIGSVLSAVVGATVGLVGAAVDRAVVLAVRRTLPA